MSRSSLRTVTNISPDGVAIDAYNKDAYLTFTVNCDSLSWVVVAYYDNTDGTSQAFYYPALGVMSAKHNGETFVGWLNKAGSGEDHNFKLGHDYTGIITIFQNFPEGSSNPLNTGDGKYDVLLGSGRIQQLVTSGKSVFIDKDISSIRAPEKYSGRVIGGCMLQIAGNQYLIESYDKSTGEVTLATALPTPFPAAGTLYYLVSNYIDCDPFTFYCRSEPECEITLTRTEEGLKCTGVYSQAENTAMQSYRFELIDKYNNVIDACDNKFTYTFEHTFPVLDGQTYWVRCTVTTQDNFIKQFTESYTAGVTDDTAISNITVQELANGIVSLSWQCDRAGKFSIYRTSDNGDITFVKTVNLYSSSGEYKEYDRTAGTNQGYVYTIVSCVDGAVYKGSSDKIKLSDYKCHISKLTEQESAYGRRVFKQGEIWSFDTNVAHGSLISALGRSLSDTEGDMPQIFYSKSRYDSGSFTAVIDTISTDKGYADLKKWLDFIEQDSLYLYRNEVGDVKIIAITDNPTRDYGSDYADLGLTTISYGWTEAVDIKRAIITA